jgi:hypothetical protein
MTASFHAVPISRSGLLKGGTVPFREFSADAALSLRDVRRFHRCTLLKVILQSRLARVLRPNKVCDFLEIVDAHRAADIPCL